MRGESYRYSGSRPAGYGYPGGDERYAYRNPGRGPDDYGDEEYRYQHPGQGPDDYRYAGEYGEYAHRNPGRGPDDYRSAGGAGEYAHRNPRRPDGYAGEGEDHWYRDDSPPRRAASWGYSDEDDEYYRPDPATGGAEGNERLTGLIGMVLLVLFAAEGFTILAIHRLLTLHFFLGMLLIGPVLLKVCSTGYRFVRYYTGDAEYRRKGPPALPLRVLGPFVVLLSLAVIGTGIMLALAGPGPGIWLTAHKAAFVLWFAVMTVHVLAYVWRLPKLVGSDLARRAGHRAQEVLGGRAARWLLLTASLLTGLLLAVITVHLAGPWVAVPHPGR